MGGRGGGSSTWTSPCGWGGPRVVGVATRVARVEMGGDTPPPEKGVKMYELAQLNLFSPEVKKGGGGSHWRFIPMCLQALGMRGTEFAGRT